MRTRKVGEGLVASEGNAHAEAIVVEEGTEENLDGKIVVLKNASTDIADRITSSAGIISERGGYLCHLAIVAREFAIPLLIGVEDATKKISSGEIIELVKEKDLGAIYSHGKKENVEHS